MAYNYIMSCGHIANTTSQIGEPCCSECLCFDIKQEIEGELRLICSHWGCPEITPYGYCTHHMCVNPKYSGEYRYRYHAEPIVEESVFHCPDCTEETKCEACKRTEHIPKVRSPFAL